MRQHTWNLALHYEAAAVDADHIAAHLSASARVMRLALLCCCASLLNPTEGWGRGFEDGYFHH